MYMCETTDDLRLKLTVYLHCWTVLMDPEGRTRATAE